MTDKDTRNKENTKLEKSERNRGGKEGEGISETELSKGKHSRDEIDHTITALALTSIAAAVIGEHLS